MNMRSTSFQNTINYLSKNTITVGLIVGIIPSWIAGSMNLGHNRQIQREAKTIEFSTIKHEKDSTIGEAINDLNIDFDLSEAREILKNGKVEEYTDFTKSFTLNDKDRYKKMLNITDYYNSIASCVESQLCDSDIATNLFKTEGANFFQNYYPFFCHFLDRWEDSLIKDNSVEFYGIKNPKAVCDV